MYTFYNAFSNRKETAHNKTSINIQSHTSYLTYWTDKIILVLSRKSPVIIAGYFVILALDINIAPNPVPFRQISIPLSSAYSHAFQFISMFDIHPNNLQNQWFDSYIDQYTVRSGWCISNIWCAQYVEMVLMMMRAQYDNAWLWFDGEKRNKLYGQNRSKYWNFTHYLPDENCWYCIYKLIGQIQTVYSG